MEEAKTQSTAAQAGQADGKPVRPKRAGARPPDRRGGGGAAGARRGGRRPEAPREFEQKILELSRVTRVTAGGKRMSFRCALVIGDKKSHRVGFGVAKGADVQLAIEKAFRQAKKNVITVPVVDGTLPHAVEVKFGSARVLLKPAPQGTGLKAGGAVRMILEFAGVPNAVSKILNSSNKINIAKATLEAIGKLRKDGGAVAKASKSKAKASGVKPEASAA